VNDDETDKVAHEVDVEETLCVAETVPLPSLAVDDIVGTPGEPDVEKVSFIVRDPLGLDERLGDSDVLVVEDTDIVIDVETDDVGVGDNVTSNETVGKVVGV
jgi:hypothetical protein